MTNTHHHQTNDLPRLKNPSINPLILVLIVLVIAVLGSSAVMRFVREEQRRELLSWQNKLGLIADSRAADVEEWLGRQFKELGGVAENPSLQLYLTELVSQERKIAEDPAQAVFLRNLMSMTADRLGFVEPVSKEIKSIDASVTQPSGVGIAILDNDGKVLVSTAGLPVLDANLSRKIQESPPGKASLLDIFTTDDGKSRLGFVLPIYAIQADAEAKPIGRLVGIKNVDNDLFKLLHQPGATEKTLEAVLLRKEGDNVAYLSPQESGKDAAARLSLDTPELDAAYALRSPGDFAVKRNAQSHPVLMTSRALDHSPWIMMLHIDRDQAMSESDVRLRQIECSLLFALCAMIGGIVAAWFYGTSKRTLLLSLETQRMAERSAAQENLLRVVADNQSEPIVITDRDNVAHFANAKAAKAFHLNAPDVAGKNLGALMGASLAKGYEEANELALARQAPYVRTWSAENESGVNAVIRSEHIPLAHVPIQGLPMPTPGVLMIDQDITEIVNEREHRVRVLRQMIDMLVTMVDRRNPYAASHSACVALVARAVAIGMGLDNARIETAETAGNLMNIGKIVVPSEVLAKPAALTHDEMRFINESLRSSIDLLEKIEFDGPVVDTLRQAQERYDGSGPLRLKGEEILVTARIIAVVNAFVGMISVRAYRRALSLSEAIRTLLAGIDTQFDRRVVVALADYVENGQGREAIERLIPIERGEGNK
jgi:HD-GYP domain-containing protein (c-di-GMP phosphodiesterase class II)